MDGLVAAAVAVEVDGAAGFGYALAAVAVADVDDDVDAPYVLLLWTNQLPDAMGVVEQVEHADDEHGVNARDVVLLNLDVDIASSDDGI